MRTITTVKEMREFVASVRSDGGKRVALVPTMGALHEGHRALIRRARETADVVVLSSFVNPLQFNNKQDLKDYPDTPKEDLGVAEQEKVDAIFKPTMEEMYPFGFQTTVNVANMSKVLEGASRPGHFRGVCTVVLKLFNIVQPEVAVFGHKDAQQLVLIKHMVRDLNIPVDIQAVRTMRDANGLALSSRNSRLNDEQREQALCLYRALRRVHFLVKKQNITHCGELLQALRSALNSAGEHVEMDYAKIVSRTTLEDLDYVERGNTLVLLAANVGGVRLLDSSRI